LNRGALAARPHAADRSQPANLVDRAPSGSITPDEYDKKARALKERQAEIAARIEQHRQGDGEYRTTLEA
jgi:hypothetical protein